MDEQRRLWIALNLILVEDIRLSCRIRREYPSPLDVFRAGTEDLVARGFDEETARMFSSADWIKRADREIDRAGKKGWSILTRDDEAYPATLREIYDPPFVLYCAGEIGALAGPAVAVVGSRTPSPYGKTMAAQIASDLAAHGLVVVSGMARGIDSESHWGALEKGRTVAVLGSGLEKIYPSENRRLFQKITESGAVVTEYPLDAAPLGCHFPQRNRIISGLSLALVVVEAARKSGSLITARLALEQNREVMAVPGNAVSDLSRGTNWLIKSGAKLVETWEDVVEELPAAVREKVLSSRNEAEALAPELTSEEQAVYECLEPASPTHVDELAERTAVSIPEILAILLNLELQGLVFQSPGKYYLRRK